MAKDLSSKTTLKELVEKECTIVELAEMLKTVQCQQERQEQHKNDMISCVDILHYMGIPANINGYKYLRYAIKISVNEGVPNVSVTKVIYPMIAKKFNTTESIVERAIRYAIEVAWTKGNLKSKEEYFGYKVFSKNGRPTNSQFIAMIADHILLTNGK